VEKSSRGESKVADNTLSLRGGRTTWARGLTIVIRDGDSRLNYLGEKKIGTTGLFEARKEGKAIHVGTEH